MPAREEEEWEALLRSEDVPLVIYMMAIQQNSDKSHSIRTSNAEIRIMGLIPRWRSRKRIFLGVCARRWWLRLYCLWEKKCEIIFGIDGDEIFWEGVALLCLWGAHGGGDFDFFFVVFYMWRALMTIWTRPIRNRATFFFF